VELGPQLLVLQVDLDVGVPLDHGVGASGPGQSLIAEGRGQREASNYSIESGSNNLLKHS